MNKLEQLKQMTVVVADTGDIEAMKQYKPVDATTNPSLLLKAAELPQYQPLLEQAVHAGNLYKGSNSEQRAYAATVLATLVGKEILSIIPGKVSTEVDARLSFDTRATIKAARQLIVLYEQQQISRDRILIKIASTWEGIQAARVLQQEGINCNLTLLFSFEQAVLAAEAGAFLVSPFVGRILDWYKKATGKENYPAAEDPGVLSVTRIYNYYKQQKLATIVMGASFRNTGEIEQLAGCDCLTISPSLMDELSKDHGTLRRQLQPTTTATAEKRTNLDEALFRKQMNDNAMATDKLADGLRLFIADQIKLEQMLARL